MIGPAALLTRLELGLLDLVSQGPKSFTDLRQDVELFFDDVRASTVSGLLAGLVNAGLMTRSGDGTFAITAAGEAAGDPGGPVVGPAVNHAAKRTRKFAAAEQGSSGVRASNPTASIANHLQELVTSVED